MIQRVILRPLRKLLDERGWLLELFRKDELGDIPLPAMSYISLTLPGITRGPHEHINQTDHFCFLGPSNFKVVLWDNRKDSSTYGKNMILFLGEDNPTSISIPPGVVHGYKNIGVVPGIVINFPDKLYKGWGRREKVDEIRHEDDPNSPFRID